HAPLQQAPRAPQRPTPSGLRQFVSKNVESQWARFAINPNRAKKDNRPEGGAQSEKPKLLGGPESVLTGRPRECGEQGGGQDAGNWQKKDGIKRVEPSGRNAPMQRR